VVGLLKTRFYLNILESVEMQIFLEAEPLGGGASLQQIGWVLKARGAYSTLSIKCFKHKVLLAQVF